MCLEGGYARFDWPNHAEIRLTLSHDVISLSNQELAWNRDWQSN